MRSRSSAERRRGATDNSRASITRCDAINGGRCVLTTVA
jgi:hypothetical protein